MAKRGLDTRIKCARLALTVAMIAALCACQQKNTTPTAAQQPPVKAADVSASRLAAAEPDQWLAAGRDANGTYYSPLKDINTGNVGQLGFAWDYHLGSTRGQESTPLVIDGVMYVSSTFGPMTLISMASGRDMPVVMQSIAASWHLKGGYTWARSMAGCMRSMRAPAN